MNEDIDLKMIRHAPGVRPNRFCGPAVVSILTGITAEAAADIIRAKFRPDVSVIRTRVELIDGEEFVDDVERKRRAVVKGTFEWEVEHVLRLHKLRLVELPVRYREENNPREFTRGIAGRAPTVAQQLADMIDRAEAAVGDTLLISAGHHFMVKRRLRGRNRWLHSCSISELSTRPVFSRSRVARVWRVERVR